MWFYHLQEIKNMTPTNGKAVIYWVLLCVSVIAGLMYAVIPSVVIHSK